jgi:hypothetical protein
MTAVGRGDMSRLAGMRLRPGLAVVAGAIAMLVGVVPAAVLM